ncbi:MAG: hypothetical protein RBS55_00970 [Bacteroidales bacterium]|nr:hypothetical protein [Bacteroidales bacterium]
MSTQAVAYDNEAGPEKNYLRAHMNDGTVFGFNRWVVIDSLRIIQGKGNHYDHNRRRIATSPDSVFILNLSDVALFETNDFSGSGGPIALAALTMAPTTVVTIICIINPKACFGSCPTFYAWDGEKMQLMAEGFSSSIAKVFEESDIDMLHHARITGKEFSLRLTNEALESHAVKFADLLAVPKNQGQRVFSTSDGRFFAVEKIYKPTACLAPEGDCLRKVLEMDQDERYSTADPANLLEKEIVEITFRDTPQGETGLIIGSRQTFMTTFLFYQGIAHAGKRMPYYLAEVERGNKRMQGYLTKIWDMLGPIEVFVQNERDKWVKAGEITEMGPIAADLRLLNLPDPGREEMKIRLRMTKGLWRIDQLGLVQTDKPVSPVRISPARVLKDSLEDPLALHLLCDTSAYLVTRPGDAYDLVYLLPENDREYELFLYSRGYYLEWMREEWLKEEDRSKMAIMFACPRQYLKMMAPEFKKIEPGIEEMFWNSRYVKN